MSKSIGRQKWRLRKIIAVQNAYQKWKTHEGVTDRWIYETHIKAAFFIGYGTMKTYLEIRAKHELQKLESCEPSE